jgi:hypothetical protein
VATCLLRARAAVGEAHYQIDAQLNKWYSDAASHCTFRPDAAVAAVAVADDSGKNMGSLGDIRALKAASRSLHGEGSALFGTVIYRIAKLGRRAVTSASIPTSGGRFVASVEPGVTFNWSAAVAVESFISQLTKIMEHLAQEIAALNAEMEDAESRSMCTQHVAGIGSVDPRPGDQAAGVAAAGSTTSAAVGDGAATASCGGDAAAVVRFQAGLVDIYHAAHKLSSRALLFHGMVSTTGDDSSYTSAASTAVASASAIDLGSIVALRDQASSMLDAVRLDLKSCACLVDASESALGELIARQDPTTSAGSADTNTDGNGNPNATEEGSNRSKLGQRDVIIESADPAPLPNTTEVFECELQTLSSGMGDNQPKKALTAEQQRELRKARMAARQLEREERLKQAAEAEKAAATARQFYDELQAVVIPRQQV